MLKLREKVVASESIALSKDQRTREAAEKRVSSKITAAKVLQEQIYDMFTRKKEETLKAQRKKEMAAVEDEEEP